MRKPFHVEHLLELLVAFRFAKTRGIWPGDVRELSPDDLRRVSALSREEVDALPFGVIRLDAERRIDLFNSFEGRASTYYPPSVVGAKFSDIAPCSAVKEFAEAIEQGYAGKSESVLRFVFPHHGARATVSVRIFNDGDRDRLWIFVSKARGAVEPRLVDAVLGNALPCADR